MTFSLTKGFASLNYNDIIARSTYIDHLPMLAECLSFQHFMSEFDIVLMSILDYPDLIQKLIKIFPLILQFFDKEQQYQIIYASGKNLSFLSNDDTKKEIMRVLEKALQEMNDITHEFKKYIVPAIMPKPDQFCTDVKFPFWRLARLTVLCNDYSPFEKLIYRLFTKDDKTLTAISKVLYLMHFDFVKKFLVRVLKSPDENDRIAAIHTIEVHEIYTNKRIINKLFLKEKSQKVLMKMAKLPPVLITKTMLRVLIKEECTSKIGCSICVSSPYFEEFLPMLKQKKGVGCEINKIDFPIISNCNPIPYEFLSMIIRESKEIINEETIESILNFDKAKVISYLILPRINEKGNWRCRYNTTMIAAKLLKNSMERIEPLDQVFIQIISGFVFAMSLDDVYAVRKAAFKTLYLFPQENAVSIIESLTSIVNDNTDDFKKQILREFFKIAQPTILKYGNRATLKNAMKLINYEDPSFFLML